MKRFMIFASLAALVGVAVVLGRRMAEDRRDREFRDQLASIPPLSDAA